MMHGVGDVENTSGLRIARKIEWGDGFEEPY